MGRMSDERADQELITAIAKGDTGCFETLYPAIRNIALTRVRRTSREVLGEVPDRAAPAEPQASDIMEVLLTTAPPQPMPGGVRTDSTVDAGGHPGR
jgi:hypothetical protein